MESKLPKHYQKPAPLTFEEGLAKLKAHGYVRLGPSNSACDEEHMREIFVINGWPLPEKENRIAELEKALAETKAEAERKAAVIETLKPATTRQYESLRVEQLLALAEEDGIEVPADADKATIIELLEKAQA